MRSTLPLFGTAFMALLATQALPAAGQTRSAAKSGDTPPERRLICRSTYETGSLVARRRQCFTRAQWDRIAEVARLRGEDLRGGAFAVDSTN
jgi:hypothetical protein